MKIFHLPDLGEGLAEAEIHEWHVKEGDMVKTDEPLVSMETAKAVVEVPSPQTGKIVKLYGKKGDIIPTHAPLVEFEESGVNKDKGTVVGNLEESNTILANDDIIVATKKKTDTIKAMPAIRALAKQLNVDLTTIKPTGARGEITADDVKNATSENKMELLHGVRRTMAIAMAHSHQEVAAVTIVDDADITRLAKDADFTVLILQAMVNAIKAEPALNAWYDGKKIERTLQSNINIGLAVDSEEGLFVPVIKNTEKKDPTALRSAINHFKKGVKERSLPVSDFEGATITLSNFGTIAGRYATPVVVPPAVAILACGKVREEAKVVDGKIVAAKVLPLSLTFDHRAVTGGEASRFLATMIDQLR